MFTKGSETASTVIYYFYNNQATDWYHQDR